MKVIFILAVCLLSFTGVGVCQTNEPIFERFQFNFATPGARADALGRAFIGLADDATAAATNPAGLVILIKPEISFEYKNTAFDTSPRNLSIRESSQNISSPAFLSYVYPTGPWRFAFYRQEYLRYKEEYSLASRLGTNAENSKVDFLGENYGAGFAYTFSQKLYAGASLRLSRLKFQTSRNFVPAFDGAPDPGRVVIDDTDQKFGFTGGIIVNPNLHVSIGAIYEYNPKFDLARNLIQDSTTTESETIHVKIPDRIGAGVAVRPTENLTLLADIVGVRYSQLSDNLTIVTLRPTKPEDYKVDNAVEFHFGAEQDFRAGTNIVALRAGVFSDPNHQLRYIGDRSFSNGEVANSLFNVGSDYNEVGFSFGAGAAFGGSNRFELNAAYVITDPFNEFSTSFILRF